MAKIYARTCEKKLKILKFVEDDLSMKRCGTAKKFSTKKQKLSYLVKNSKKTKANMETRKRR